MARRLGALTFIALLAAVVAASAAQAKPQRKATATKAARPTTLMSAGKVVKFDSGSNTLTVSTPQGEQQFVLSSSSRLTEGRKTVEASQLSTLTDRQVQVRYTESDGRKMVSSLRITAGPKATVTKTTPKKNS